jgi:hypothetical protein
MSTTEEPETSRPNPGCQGGEDVSDPTPLSHSRREDTDILPVGGVYFLEM